MKDLTRVDRHDVGVIFRDIHPTGDTPTGPHYWMICTAEGRMSDVLVWAAADVLKMYPDCEVVGLFFEPHHTTMAKMTEAMNKKAKVS